jgi:hypothetical protein
MRRTPLLLSVLKSGACVIGGTKVRRGKACFDVTVRERDGSERPTPTSARTSHGGKPNSSSSRQTEQHEFYREIEKFIVVDADGSYSGLYIYMYVCV